MGFRAPGWEYYCYYYCGQALLQLMQLRRWNLLLHLLCRLLWSIEMYKIREYFSQNGQRNKISLCQMYFQSYPSIKEPQNVWEILDGNSQVTAPYRLHTCLDHVDMCTVVQAHLNHVQITTLNGQVERADFLMIHEVDMSPPAVAVLFAFRRNHNSGKNRILKTGHVALHKGPCISLSFFR